MTFGFLSPLYTMVSWIIVQFHSLFSNVFDPNGGWAWGLSIVMMVVVIRICLIPLFVKQIKATRAMQAIQPKMKAIQERYKNDRQRQSEEMMKLYKEAGTNPFSSCLPILVQAPFFTALYGVLAKVANHKPIGVISDGLLDSAQKAHIFGAPLSAKFIGSGSLNVQIITAAMIVLMSLSQFITQRQLMTKNVDLSVQTPFMQQQKMLMYVFPVMFAVMGINFPVGVLVYWLTTNVWTMGQQLIVIHNNPTPGSKAFEERQERLKRQGRLNPDGSVKKLGLLALISGGTKSAPAAAATAVEDAVHVRRQQPRKQTKAQRQAAGSAHTGAAAKPSEPQDAVPAQSVKESGTRPAGQRQQPKRSGQAGQRPKKKS